MTKGQSSKTSLALLFQQAASNRAPSHLVASTALARLSPGSMYHIYALIPAPFGWCRLDRIDQATLPLDGVYAPGLTGAGVHIYVLDTGLRASHQDFAGRIGKWSCLASLA